MRLKEMKPWQLRRILLWFLLIVVLSTAYLGYTAHLLYQDRAEEARIWQSTYDESEAHQAMIAERGSNAVPVTVGSYIENLKQVDIKGSSFRLVALIWFRWQGDPELDMMNHFEIYKGSSNSKEVIKNYSENGENYQLIRMDMSVTKHYWTRRFPLESHQLRFYLESTYPIEQVVLVADTEESGLNENLGIAGYDVVRHMTTTTCHEYANNHGDPEIAGTMTTSEFVTAIEINRSDFGLYVKCFIALYGTLIWVLIALFLSTYHRIDVLGMLPGMLFGTVANVMVGSNLLPDALQMGLLEFVNTWGVLTILVATIAIININYLRSNYQDRDFAHFFGRLMFYSIMVVIVVGNILLPMCAYLPM